jgi:hypothetical protein
MFTDVSEVIATFVIGAMSGYGLDDPGYIPGTDKLFFSPLCSDWQWGPHSFLSSVFSGFIFGG